MNRPKGRFFFAYFRVRQSVAPRGIDIMQHLVYYICIGWDWPDRVETCQMSNAFIIYQGPSALDGAPIVAVATGFKRSRNAKTGDMVQVWIIRSDMHPVEANRIGADVGICGQCPHRGRVELLNGVSRNVGRTCYVRVPNAPAAVYRAFAAGKYGLAPIDCMAGRAVRIGAYGDPAAVPMAIWQTYLPRAAAVTGYTHQWRTYPELQAWCMASCDNGRDYLEAKAAGWRTFRVRNLADPVLAREVVCPASKEAGYKTVCALCRACGGASSKAKADIVI